MYLTSSFGVFLMRQFMLSQPKALEEAALMDGAGYFKIFWRISLPQLRPALSALGIITFTQTWNYYFQARVLLGKETVDDACRSPWTCCAATSAPATSRSSWRR